MGRQFGVRVRAVDVFCGGACASGRHGLCLDALDPRDAPQAEQVGVFIILFSIKAMGSTQVFWTRGVRRKF